MVKQHSSIVAEYSYPPATEHNITIQKAVRSTMSSRLSEGRARAAYLGNTTSSEVLLEKRKTVSNVQLKKIVLPNRLNERNKKASKLKLPV